MSGKVRVPEPGTKSYKQLKTANVRGRRSSPQGYPAAISEPEDRHIAKIIQTKWVYEEICMYICIHVCVTQQLKKAKGMSLKERKSVWEHLRWGEERNKNVYML